MASAVAFVTTKRRESFLSHMVPSVTESQKRKLLSDPIFQQKDLFTPATLKAARHAARDVSLYKGAQSRPSMSRLRGGLSLRLLLPEVVLGHLLSLHCSALQHHLLLGVFRPRSRRPIPRRNVGVFGGRSLSPRPA